jgi:predicted dehydrogenase
MSEKVALGVIGLGAVGTRSLGYLLQEPALAVSAIWDPADPSREHETVARAISAGARFADDAADVIQHSDLVYIATPPRFHRVYAQAVLEAGKLCWCEKPLSVDKTDALAMIEAARRAKLPTAVNFAYASAWCAHRLKRLVSTEAVLGELCGISIRLHFKAWPRPFQAHATWLSQREEGGFVREVLSHHIYLAQVLLGPLQRLSHTITYPTDAQALAYGHRTEIALLASLRSEAGIPVQVAAMVGGWRDATECQVMCEHGAARIIDWYGLEVDEGEGFRPLSASTQDPREEAYRRQAAHIAAFAQGKPHSWASFEDAWQVQALIESLLQ